MPVILDYRNIIQNFVHGADRSVWAKNLVAAAVINNGNLTDDQILQICADIDNRVTSPSIVLPGNIGSAIPRVELKMLKHVANVNRLVSDQTIHFFHDGITVLFGNNGSGKSSYFRILNKLANGSNYSANSHTLLSMLRTEHFKGHHSLGVISVLLQSIVRVGEEAIA